jgi:hypothetical protein
MLLWISACGPFSQSETSLLIWLELTKLIFAAIAAGAAAWGAWMAIRNWKNAVENTRIANTNAENAARWKRAELASSYLVPLFQDDELAFALRCIDWGTGVIPIPQRHLAMFGDQKTIEHDPALLVRAMKPILTRDVRDNPQGMLYRLAFDALFTRLEWIGYRVSSGLIRIEDVPDLKYWMNALSNWPYASGVGEQGNRVFLPFLKELGYGETLKLMMAFGFASAQPLPAPDSQLRASPAPPA